MGHCHQLVKREGTSLGRTKKAAVEERRVGLQQQTPGADGTEGAERLR